jgi:hypothetical protein
MDPWTMKLEEFARSIREDTLRRWRGLKIPRVFSNAHDDTDLDDAPDAFVGARLIPRRPLGGSAIALPEPDEDLMVGAIASGNDLSRE